MEKEKRKLIKAASEKIDTTVTTFLNGDNNGRLFKRVIWYSYEQIVSESVKLPTIKMASEKVTYTVGTFLKKNPMVSRLSTCQQLKLHHKRLPTWWEPFRKRVMSSSRLLE